MTTLTADPPHSPPPPRREPDPDFSNSRAAPRMAPTAQSSRRGPSLIIGLWVSAVIASVLLVLFLLEPLFQTGTQSQLLDSYRTEIQRAANETNSLYGVTVPTKAPEPGAPVGILEAGAVHLRQVVVEGASAGETQAGPGHVPGTAALGQPGNSVVVGRRSWFGGPFDELHQLHTGDQILSTTTQGQVVYEVSGVQQVTIVDDSAEAGAPGTVSAATGTVDAPQAGEGTITVDELYGPTDDDRLTLVTSDSVLPWNKADATVVTARMVGLPFDPTPQGGRTDANLGLSGDASVWPALMLAMLGFSAAAAAAVYLYSRSTMRVAYLLTAPPLLVAGVLLAESASRLFPAWV